MISEELLKLQATKKALKDAENKYGLGVDDATPFAEYADKVNNICELTTGLPANATFDLKDEKAQAGIWASADMRGINTTNNYFSQLNIKHLNMDGTKMKSYSFNGLFNTNPYIETLIFIPEYNGFNNWWSTFAGMINLKYVKIGIKKGAEGSQGKEDYTLNLFQSCTNLIYADLSDFNADNTSSFYCCFNGCSSLKHVDLTNFSFANAKNISCFFTGCKSLPSVDVSGFDTSNIVDMSGMFASCEKLTEIDISNFDVSKCTNMNEFLSRCRSLKKVKGIEKINPKNCSFDSFFMYCDNMESIDMSGINDTEVTTIALMFYGCTKLKDLNLGKPIYSETTRTNNAFILCSELTNITGSPIIDVGLSLSYSSKLTRDSAMVIINGLMDRTGKDTLRIEFSGATKNLLTDNDKLIAIQKNWTIA